MTEKTKRAYDKWAKKYDLDLNPHLLLEKETVMKLVNAKKGEQILDAACGTGKYANEFFRYGASVTGIDFSKEMLEVAKQKNPKINYQLADFQQKLMFDDNIFDKINCAQALKHVKALKFTLKEFYRILKKEGRLIFSVSHPDMDWTDYEMKKDVSLDLTLESDIFHHRFCDYFEAFEQVGFKIDEIKQIRVSDKIEHLLTPESFKKVKGRYEIIVFKLKK